MTNAKVIDRMAQPPHEKRRTRTIRELKSQSPSATALLVTNVTNVTWLTGFTGDSTWLVLTKDKTILISDTRYETQLADECPGIETVIRSNVEPLEEKAGRVARQLGLTKLAFESDMMSVDQHGLLDKELKATTLVPLSGLVENLRAIKDAGEIEQTRIAVQLAERGFDALRATLRPEATELEVAHDLEHTIRRLGSPGLAFPAIVGVGATAALPHAHPGHQRIGEAPFVLVDWGANAPSGYKSDITRVLVTGKVPAKLEKIYRTVLAAQKAGIAAIRPGAICKDVDAAARKVIEDAGFGKRFGHGLGHGIGLNIHEQPRFSPKSEQELKAGMIVTVEPGIYLPGWGGVRIEDDVLVTRGGNEVLTSVPKEWEEVCTPCC